MPVASAHAGARAYPAPPVRIRTVLLACLLATAVWLLYPRADAAWRLHGSATLLADYALCMAGPTGPSLIRDNPEQFYKVVRRRVLAAAPEDRIFARCADAAGILTGSDDVARSHRVEAAEFVEYGGSAADRVAKGNPSGLELKALEVSTRILAELSESAWPFSRQGYTRLIRPSLNAKEAIHPVDVPRPGIGKGLPVWRALYRPVLRTEKAHWVAFGRGDALSVYRSDDGGLNWKPASVRHPAVQDFAERCGGAAKYFTFGVSDDDRAIVVRSHDAAGARHNVPIAPARSRVLAAACDADSMAVALQRDERQDVGLVMCAHRGACAPMPLPVLRREQQSLGKLDLARIEGVTVIALPMNGVVRVTSSRDNGRSWTPLSVAFDAEAHPEVRTHVRTPSRLLSLGKRLLLFGGASKPAMTYPVLVSDDYGASWRTPGT